MTIWWESLTMLEQVLLYIAVPATLVLLIQTVLLFLGGVAGGDADGHMDLGGHDSVDVHLDADAHDTCAQCGGDHDASGHEGHAAGLNILTIRGVVAFFTLFGWGGLWLLQLGLRPFWSLFLGVQLGIIGMVVIAFLLREASRLQYDGTMDPCNAVGQTGTVYLTVPAVRGGQGKVNVLVQDQLREFEAVTDRDSPIPTGAEVLITGLADGETLLVDPK